MSIEQGPFGKTVRGEEVQIFRLLSQSGLEARITNYGGIVVSLRVPDARGNVVDVVLGHEEFEPYLSNRPYFGCIVGRYGNRIGRARFRLDGQEYRLTPNEGPNCLHGGLKGFDRVVWSASAEETGEGPALLLRHVSPDGENGFPGNLDVLAVYTLTNEGCLRLYFTATTDRATVINLTHHSYFNLGGAAAGHILDHEVTILADKFTPTDDALIPTGEICDVEGTPLDFRKPHPIGKRINCNHELIRTARGYDHNYVLDSSGPALARAPRVQDPRTGRVMEVWTTAPGMQFYTGNFPDRTVCGKQGVVYQRHHAFCMEPQHFPDSPNKPHFPSTVPHPGQEYRHTIKYCFRCS